MTTTTRHIEDLGVDEWAALTRRAAVEAVAAAERRGKTPPPELVALTGMTERQLVERRARNGPASRRLSPLMQFLEADHMRRIAEGRARDAHQDKLDAEAVAAAARVEAQQRAAERTAASEAAEQTAQQLRGELERVRADADAEIAASRGWAAGEAAAVREAADAEVARAYAAADEAIRQAQARAARTLSMPVPPFEFRTETAHIENALNALHQIDYMLEVGMSNDGDPDIPLDIDLMQTLTRAVRLHAIYLCNESQSATSPSPGDAAAAYAKAAADAFRAFLHRIETVAVRLGNRRSPDAEIVNVVTAMLADPWVQRARRMGSQAP